MDAEAEHLRNCRADYERRKQYQKELNKAKYQANKPYATDQEKAEYEALKADRRARGTAKRKSMQ